MLNSSIVPSHKRDVGVNTNCPFVPMIGEWSLKFRKDSETVSSVSGNIAELNNILRLSSLLPYTSE